MGGYAGYNGPLGGGHASAPQFTQSRMGDSVTLVRPASVPALIPDGSPATPLPRVAQAILEVDLMSTQDQKAALYGAGSWVLTLDATATYQELGPVDGNRILPVRAIVTIGTGGAAQQFEVDVRNTSFQLPAANVKIVIDWDEQVPACDLGDGWIMPDRVRVVASLQRGFSQGRATRSLWLAQTPSVILFGAVPNFAKCVRLWGGLARSEALWADFLLSFNTDREVAGSELIQYTGAQLLNPSGVPVPTLAQSWALATPAFVVGTNMAFGPLEFDVVL